MRAHVHVEELGGEGPRVLLLPGLGARGSGLRALGEALRTSCRPVLVEYPERQHAGVGPGELATQLASAVGAVDAAIVSSFGGLVAAHLGARGLVRGLAFLGSFTNVNQLGLRGRALPLMGPIALVGRPGLGAATIAANRLVLGHDVREVVPTTATERWSTWHRAFAIGREPPPPSLRDTAVSCLALQGTRDVLVPAATLPKLLAALPAGSKGHLLPGAGHVPYFTHVEACVTHLAPWLAALAESTPLDAAFRAAGTAA